MRLAAITSIGAILIAGVMSYRDRIHHYIWYDSPKVVQHLAKSVSGKLNGGISIAEITKEINHRMASGSVQENPFGIPVKYRYNKDASTRYRSWIDETIKDSKRTGGIAIIIDKAAYTLDLYKNGIRINSFNIELGPNPVDEKYMEGDGCTPEGRYSISKRKDKGQTSFYRAFLIDYPRKKDKLKLAKMKEKGLAPSNITSGSLIEIHGRGSGMKGKSGGTNWTAGCIALSDNDMDYLFNCSVRKKIPVTIVRYGTRVTY